MADLALIVDRRGAQGPRSVLLPLTTWHAGHGRVDSPPEVIRAAQDCGMGAAACLVCDGPIGDQPFTVHTLILDGPCATGSVHLPSVTSAIHVCCPIPSEQEMCDRLLAVAQDCSD